MNKNKRLPWYSAGSTVLTAGYWVLIVFGVLLFLPLAFDGKVFGAIFGGGVFGFLAFVVRLLGSGKAPRPESQGGQQKSNLITCPDCKKDVSRSAESCPHCGSKALPTFAAQGEGVIRLIGAVLIIGFMIYFWRSCSFEPDSKKSVPATVKSERKTTMPTETLPSNDQLFEYTDDMEPLASGLEAGKKYRVIEQLTICPYHSDDLPDDPQKKLQAIADVRQLKGNEFFITVLEIRPHNNINWYRVKWQDETGWVNSVSLLNRVEPAPE